MGMLELLFGVPAERFLAETWPDRPRHATGPVARFAGIVDHPVLRDIPTFLRGHHEDVAQRVPGVQVWIDGLVEELSLAFGDHQGTCRAQVTRAGAEVGKHFDHRDLFLVQLHGRARWRLAPNDALAAPLATHVAGGPVHPANREGDLAALAAPAMPPGAEVIVLEPGAALFIPRGTWQAIEVLDDSLTLAFAFRVPPWLDLVVHAVVAILAGEPAWRATVEGAPSEALVRAMDRAIETLMGIELPQRPYNHRDP